MKKLLFLFFLISFNTFCQKTKPIYGAIIDSIGPVLDANILNKNSKTGTNSNSEGEFKIYAQIGDTLVISSIQHQTKKIIVNERSFVSFNFKINLKLKTYELNEFELKKHTLLGILALDINNIKKNENEISAVTLGLPNAGIPLLKPIDRKIYTATTSNGLIPLDLILNSITGRLKQLKQEKKITEEDAVVAKLYSEFKFNLVPNFKIDKEDEYRFLYYCVSDSTFIIERAKNKFDFINFLKAKAIEFNKLKND